MRVSIEELQAMFKYRREINRADLRKVEWIKRDGSKVEVPEDLLERHEFCGLNNCDFLYELEQNKLT